MVHYNYRHINPINRNCKTCKKIILDHTKSQKCPDPIIMIQRFLQQNTDFTGQISIEDCICYICLLQSSSSHHQTHK